MAPQETRETVASELERMDTAGASVVHALFPMDPTDRTDLRKAIAVPYGWVVLCFFLLPTVGAALADPHAFREAFTEPEVKFHMDLQHLCEFLVTLPVLFIIVLNERRWMPQGIAAAVRAGVLSMTPSAAGHLRTAWERKFRRSNLTIQLFGIVVGGAVGVWCHHEWLSMRGSWMSTDNGLTPLGWCFVTIQIPFVFWLATVYALRTFGTCFFLADLVRESTIRVLPLHPDNAGGLRPIGQIGLRSQYVLGIAGLNIAFQIANLSRLEGAPGPGALAAAVTAFYLVFAPIVFLGPLLPFRSAMLADKERLATVVAANCRRLGEQLRSRLDSGTGADPQDLDTMERLSKASKTIGALPVWPVDMGTLRRFVTAYVIPVFAMVAARSLSLAAVAELLRAK